MKAFFWFAPLALAACSAPPASDPAEVNDAATPASPSGAPTGSDAPAMNAPAPPVADPPVPPSGRDPCRSVNGSDFAAWVNAMPGPNARPKLIVIGKVTAPTGGYRIRFGELTVMESYPVQIIADLVVTPPAGPATQAVMTHDVRGEWPSEEKVGAVTVRCGSKTIARISPVETAH